MDREREREWGGGGDRGVEMENLETKGYEAVLVKAAAAAAAAAKRAIFSPSWFCCCYHGGSRRARCSCIWGTWDRPRRA